MPIIVIDTNVIRPSPLLRSKHWVSLVDHAAAWDLRIAVPEVAVMEAINVVRKAWSTACSEIEALKLKQRDLGDVASNALDDIATRIESYPEDLTKRLGEIGVEVIGVPSVSHIDIARRASERRPPYQESEKDGYRDTLIWLTLLKVAEDNSETEVWFVSNNTRDFGPADKNWDGNGGGDREDCPIVFHSALVDEIDARGLTGRVRYVASIGRLEQHFAALYAPISDENLRTLIGAIDLEDFKRQLTEEVIGFQLDPEQAALPLAMSSNITLLANITAARWIADPTIDEAAGRGPDSWSARFSMDADVDVLMGDTSLSLSETSKTLTVSGEATFGNTGNVEGLKVTSVEALDGDPMIAVWDRLHKPQGVNANTEIWSRLRNAAVGVSSPMFDASRAAGLISGVRADSAIGQAAGLISGVRADSAIGQAAGLISGVRADSAIEALTASAGLIARSDQSDAEASDAPFEYTKEETAE